MAVIATSDDYQIDEDVIIGVPETPWVQPPVRNKMQLRYDFNVPGVVTSDFGRRLVYTAQESVTRYAIEQAVAFDMRGVRHELGGLALMDRLAVIFMQRWGFQPWFLRVSVLYLKHPLEILDTVRVSHPDIANPRSGQRGLVREQMEVIDVEPVFGPPQGFLRLLLMWTGGIEVSAAPIRVSAGLKPPDLFFDGTDVSVPEAGSATVRTQPDSYSARLALRRNTWRWWTGVHQVNGPTILGPCEPQPDLAYNDWTFNSAVTYQIDYKLIAAPNVTATTPGDPSTGWVTTWPAVRGNTSTFNTSTCRTEPTFPGAPSEDSWVVDLGVLAQAPNEYDIRVQWLSTAVVGAPGMGCDCFWNLGDCRYGIGPSECQSTFIGNELRQEARTLTIDSLESHFQPPVSP